MDRLPNHETGAATQTVLIYRNELLAASETFIRDQALALRDWRPVLVGRKLLNQLPLDDLNVRCLTPHALTLSNRLLWRASSMFDTVPPNVKAALRKERASLIHVHFGTDALDAWPLARALNLPLLITLHGFDINVHRDWWEAGNAGSHLRSYPRRLLQLAQLPQISFVAVSEAIRNRAIESGIPPGKVEVKYIGIDPRKFTPGSLAVADRAPRVLFVGRLVEKKGCLYLIDAMVHVRKNVPDARLIVIGDGPLRQHLEHHAREVGIEADFLGVQPHAEVKRQLELARVFCLPSVTASNGDAEGLPISILEAQASGVPVVTSANGAVGEAVKEGHTGLLFPERDVVTLATKLTALLSDDALASKVAAQSVAQIAKSFDIADLTRSLEDAYGVAARRTNLIPLERHL
ncbi:glycosyltransferase [Bradyrhizobium sp. LTSP857]|uniref:glycosyltransferase n=1 Tax=Bradyrhizobium sp. LTSP857 TaxID=1619231 RepID=UPI0005D17DC8|nr:glycosyltransferase [Bradyrhizobium sp. LTSP857]